MKEGDEVELKMMRWKVVSATIMTMKIALKAGGLGVVVSSLLDMVGSVTRPINAVLEGALVTALVASVITQDFTPVLWIFLVLLGLQLLTDLANRFAGVMRSKVW